MYQKIGYRCFSGSIIKDDLLNLKKTMKNKVNMISGHSGVGKSTLINLLQPELSIKISEILRLINRHTTTFSQLYDLDFGVLVIDTPGIRGFGLVEIDVKEIANCFPEIFAEKEKCKFFNCSHKDEPNCAVKTAVKENRIDSGRYQNYLKMLIEEDTSLEEKAIK